MLYQVFAFLDYDFGEVVLVSEHDNLDDALDDIGGDFVECRTGTNSSLVG